MKKYYVEIDSFYSDVDTCEQVKECYVCDKLHTSRSAAYKCLIKYLKGKRKDFDVAIQSAKNAEKKQK